VPDTDFLGVYSLYKGNTIAYTKLAIGEDDSVLFDGKRQKGQKTKIKGSGHLTIF